LALRASLLAGVALCWLSQLLGCAKKEAAVHRTEPWLAKPSSSRASSASAPRTFHFVQGSSIAFSVPGRKGKVSGHVPLGEGKLRLDPRDLKSASASIDVDLTKLSIDAEQLPEGVELSGSSPAAIALQWLELGPAVPAERRAELANARFELASVEDLSAPFIELDARRKGGHVRALAVGTLLIHGFRAPVRASVLLEPLKTLPGAAPRLSIRSAAALVVPLAPHDIGARSPSGTADALGTARAADWVGRNVRIEFGLIAEAEPVDVK
jgi:hypothetical protein